MEREVNGVKVEVVQGDITAQDDVGAVVNAANAELQSGGGVAGAIHEAAGPGLEEESRPLAPIEPGEAVLTGAYGLPNSYVIHTLGPVYGSDEPADEFLADCYRNSLALAEEHGLESLAFPAISTGAYGFPPDRAARIALAEIVAHLTRDSSLHRVTVVAFNPATYRAHQDAFEEFVE